MPKQLRKRARTIRLPIALLPLSTVSILGSVIDAAKYQPGVTCAAPFAPPRVKWADNWWNSLTEEGFNCEWKGERVTKTFVVLGDGKS